MARRKNTSVFEDLFELAAMLPWWVGTILAAVAYSVLHRYAVAAVSTNVAPGQIGQMVAGQMTKALAGVTLARIDIDQFDEKEIETVGLSTSAVPWFVLFDDKLEITDAITSGECDDDIPENMAPVLGAFAHGTYKNRRHGG